MLSTNTDNIKRASKLTTLETLGQEVYKLIWKYGLWIVVLMCTVASRLFYEMIYNPEVSFRKLLALAGLSSAVGTLAIVSCASMGFNNGWSIGIVVISGICAYRLVEYFVSLDGPAIFGWFRDIVNRSIPQKKD